MHVSLKANCLNSKDMDSAFKLRNVEVTAFSMKFSIFILGKFNVSDEVYKFSWWNLSGEKLRLPSHGFCFV